MALVNFVTLGVDRNCSKTIHALTRIELQVAPHAVHVKAVQLGWFDGNEVELHKNDNSNNNRVATQKEKKFPDISVTFHCPQI